MIDNSAYHNSRATQEFMARMLIPVLFLGPCQFFMAPVERFFGFIKGRALNPLMYKTLTK
jgi:hypothetical protein